MIVGLRSLWQVTLQVLSMTACTAKISGLLGLTLLVVTACGPAPFKPAKRVTIRPSSYSYEYNDHGCKTGKQTFASQDEYCKGLMDDELNNNCARESREGTYNQKCRYF